MTSRSIYAWLIARHPRSFRIQFEQEMLDIFDQQVPEEGAIPLQVDAAISLFRQWVLRSSNRRTVNSAILAECGLSPNPLQLRSQELHREAWRVNLVWLFACCIVLCNYPSPSRARPVFDGGVALLMFGIMLHAYRNHKRGMAGKAQHYSSLSISGNLYRKELIRKRDSLELWAGGRSSSWLRLEGSPVFALFFQMIVPLLFGLPAWVHTRSFMPQVDPATLLLYVPAVITMIALWSLVRKANLCAVQALQEEIDVLAPQ
jgi:hypothetical protein